MTCQLFGNLTTNRKIVVQKNSWVMDQGEKKKRRCGQCHHCDKGSNALQHIDLYLKLKPYSFAINDSSRYVVWMEAKQTTAPK